MNSLLPIFSGPPNGSSVPGSNGSTTGIMGQVSTGHPKLSAQNFVQAFSQVLHEQGEMPAFLKSMQAVISPRNQHDGGLLNFFLQNEVRYLKSSADSEVQDNSIRKIQFSKTQEASEELLPLASDSDILLEIARLLSPPSVIAPLVVTNESGSNQHQGISFEQHSLPGLAPTISPSPFQGIQPHTPTGIQGHEFQQSGGNLTLGGVPSELEIDRGPIRNAHNSLLKVFDPGTGPSQGPLPNGTETAQTSQEATGRQVSLGVGLEKGAPVPADVPSPKGVPSGLQQFGRLLLEDEISRPQILQRLETPLLRSHNVQATSISPGTVLQAEGPAGFTGPAQTNQLALKAILGNSPVLGEGSGSGFQHHPMTAPADGIGESTLVSTGERVQSIGDPSVKSLGVDSGNGQGLGSGMNQFSQSQPGFQQSQMFPGQGVGLRAMEERGVEFPAQALQRLQMDVQLSDNQRVMIDVGVQNKQVYAGLVMDHAILRNLANQFVPQLENQLSQLDLELQEFSAEVREERQQEPDALFDDARSHERHPSEQGAQDEGPLTSHLPNRQSEPGLHFLA